MYQYGIASAKGKDALRQRKSYKMISINIIEARFFLRHRLRVLPRNFSLSPKNRRLLRRL